MKELVKLFSTITGIFRSVVTIVFLLAIAFVALVDVNLLMAAVDIAGFPNIAKGLIKAILIGIFALSFIINVIITRHIFKAGTTGKYHISNLCFALIFIIIDAFIFVMLRDTKTILIYIIMALNALIVINSILGLIAKSRGAYEDEHILEEDVKPKEYIEFENKNDVVKANNDKIKIDDTSKVKTSDSNYQLLEKDKKMVYESSPKTNKDQGQTVRIAKKKEKKENNVGEEQ
ncbi:hypothetical protein [Anaerococcus sp. Marseille-Q7828]|uniref:hypothetical protein n=1 Tax=Anaerococcus sp. Marseille-Q7828 TaxID=3036300 RepID=UPI0024ADC195|nr:hypothetical protein [Anaerococcus sp. Marseille-Q7828]